MSTPSARPIDPFRRPGFTITTRKLSTLEPHPYHLPGFPNMQPDIHISMSPPPRTSTQPQPPPLRALILPSPPITPWFLPPRPSHLDSVSGPISGSEIQHTRQMDNMPVLRVSDFRDVHRSAIAQCHDIFDKAEMSNVTMYSISAVLHEEEDEAVMPTMESDVGSEVGYMDMVPLTPATSEPTLPPPSPITIIDATPHKHNNESARSHSHDDLEDSTPALMPPSTPPSLSPLQATTPKTPKCATPLTIVDSPTIEQRMKTNTKNNKMLKIQTPSNEAHHYYHHQSLSSISISIPALLNPSAQPSSRRLTHEARNLSVVGKQEESDSGSGSESANENENASTEISPRTMATTTTTSTREGQFSPPPPPPHRDMMGSIEEGEDEEKDDYDMAKRQGQRQGQRQRCIGSSCRNDNINIDNNNSNKITGCRTVVDNRDLESGGTKNDEDKGEEDDKDGNEGTGGRGLELRKRQRESKFKEELE